MNTKQEIAEHGNGQDYWLFPYSFRSEFDALMTLRQGAEPSVTYSAEASNSKDLGCLSGPRRNTVEEAREDLVRYKEERSADFDTWLIVKNETCFKISIEEEL